MAVSMGKASKFMTLNKGETRNFWSFCGTTPKNVGNTNLIVSFRVGKSINEITGPGVMPGESHQTCSPQAGGSGRDPPVPGVWS